MPLSDLIFAQPPSKGGGELGTEGSEATGSRDHSAVICLLALMFSCVEEEMLHPDDARQSRSSASHRLLVPPPQEKAGWAAGKQDAAKAVKTPRSHHAVCRTLGCFYLELDSNINSAQTSDKKIPSYI